MSLSSDVKKYTIYISKSQVINLWPNESGSLILPHLFKKAVTSKLNTLNNILNFLNSDARICSSQIKINFMLAINYFYYTSTHVHIILSITHAQMTTQVKEFPLICCFFSLFQVLAAYPPSPPKRYCINFACTFACWLLACVRLIYKFRQLSQLHADIPNYAYVLCTDAYRVINKPIHMHIAHTSKIISHSAARVLFMWHVCWCGEIYY